MLDWNDLRYFLAVARDGSTLAAARALRVSQTTVARRIAALEEALSIHLFEKRQAGYALTPVGQELLAHAEQVETALSGFSEAAAAQSRTVSGNVKITTEEVYSITLLAPLLTDLHRLHPDIVIELDTSQTVRDPAPVRRTFRSAAPRGRTRRQASSAGSSASMTGRSTAAATMPPATGCRGIVPN
jgi:DNA-binding transcriptional LysR family regulator